MNCDCKRFRDWTRIVSSELGSNELRFRTVMVKHTPSLPDPSLFFFLSFLDPLRMRALSKYNFHPQNLAHSLLITADQLRHLWDFCSSPRLLLWLPRAPSKAAGWQILHLLFAGFLLAKSVFLLLLVFFVYTFIYGTYFRVFCPFTPNKRFVSLWSLYTQFLFFSFNRFSKKT